MFYYLSIAYNFATYARASRRESVFSGVAYIANKFSAIPVAIVLISSSVRVSATLFSCAIDCAQSPAVAPCLFRTFVISSEAVISKLTFLVAVILCLNSYLFSPNLAMKITSII